MAGKKPPVTRPGLDVLLGQTSSKGVAPGAQRLPVTALRPGAGQPRREFDEGRLEELAVSIRERGLLQPLLVRPVGDGHEIVAGERRWRAAQLAGLTEVPVIVRTDLSDADARVLALLENLQREDLNTVDEVDAKLDVAAAVLGLGRDEARGRLMQLLREPDGEEHQALDAAFRSLRETWRSFTKNKLRILNWPPAVLQAVRAGLPYRLGQLIVKAPEEHHAALVAFAQANRSEEAVAAEVSRLLTTTPPPRPAAARVGQMLSSARWRSRLSGEDEKALDRWLAKAPAFIKDQLE
ncbi:ParB/RepB/Spo0J family partition protein [Deinococcus cavernae]|uniref:ParB/RepB/Spo0J family partition protein n=1 Tax=Deinococcus cavernae TaxID=2320857 RepID=A0A418VEQ3_9DEIO|nr:ParB/RepB/Spo0J family partition protein [Deinococcus cavernae]RJF74548.1 ParB/RepB/Spo0J family partition protein [Deinococcus cavernae]